MAGDQRQFVNFLFCKVDPQWLFLPDEERRQGKEKFLEVVEAFSPRVLVVSYTTLGIRADADLMLWRISEDLDLFSEMSAQFLNAGLGKYLRTAYSYLSMTKTSVYVSEHQHEGQEGTRVRLVTPGKKRYLFVYPFVKIRDWYRLDVKTRQEMMNQHIRVGHKYPSVKLNTTYSFGLDEQEFVVAFESDKPGDFLDLVMDLRETEASSYTARDIPTFTCIRKNLREILDSLG